MNSDNYHNSAGCVEEKLIVAVPNPQWIWRKDMVNIIQRICNKLRERPDSTPILIRFTRQNEAEFLALGPNDLSKYLLARIEKYGVREGIGGTFRDIPVQWDHDGEDFEIEYDNCS